VRRCAARTCYGWLLLLLLLLLRWLLLVVDVIA
jgi:hypothetical protein